MSAVWAALAEDSLTLLHAWLPLRGSPLGRTLVSREHPITAPVTAAAHGKQEHS